MISLKLPNLDCSRGAPMGRPEFHRFDLGNTVVQFVLQYVPFFDGGYDEGGAYWGFPYDLYRAVSVEHNIEMFIRAESREKAKYRVCRFYKNATFEDPNPEAMTAFALGYVETALWSSELDGATVDPKDYAVILERCAQFQKENHKLLVSSGLNEAAQGHNFWLNHNGHGAGFWDLGLHALSDACKRYPENALWTDDTGVVHGWE